MISFYSKNKWHVFSSNGTFVQYSISFQKMAASCWGNILDTAAINACAICRKSTDIQLSPRKFILELIEHFGHQKQQLNCFPIPLTSRSRKRYKTGCNSATTYAPNTEILRVGNGVEIIRK